jgi:hypothetical protein
MHQQIRTSPGSVGGNVSHAVEALARRGVNVEGVGPDYESPHVRIVVPHDATEDAIEALEGIPDFTPRAVPACTFALAHRPGQLDVVLQRVARAGFEVQSVLVLASRYRGMTLVSLGLDREPSSTECEALGCVEEPEGWIGGDLEGSAAS